MSMEAELYLFRRKFWITGAKAASFDVFNGLDVNKILAPFA